jgi:hypothetical protein
VVSVAAAVVSVAAAVVSVAAAVVSVAAAVVSVAAAVVSVAAAVVSVAAAVVSVAAAVVSVAAAVVSGGGGSVVALASPATDSAATPATETVNNRRVPLDLAVDFIVSPSSLYGRFSLPMLRRAAQPVCADSCHLPVTIRCSQPNRKNTVIPSSDDSSKHP